MQARMATIRWNVQSAGICITDLWRMEELQAQGVISLPNAIPIKEHGPLQLLVFIIEDLQLQHQQTTIQEAGLNTGASEMDKEKIRFYKELRKAAMWIYAIVLISCVPLCILRILPYSFAIAFVLIYMIAMLRFNLWVCRKIGGVILE